MATSNTDDANVTVIAHVNAVAITRRRVDLARIIIKT